jgi:cyclase
MPRLSPALFSFGAVFAFMSASASLFAPAVLAQQAPAQPPGQQDFSRVEIATTDLGHRTYMLQGAGGNIVAALGDDGIIMVDTQFAPLHDKIKAALSKLSPQPVRYVVSTHFHSDHVDGNAAFAREGATVAAQENVLKRMSMPTPNERWGGTSPPSPPASRPTMTYSRQMALKVKGREAQLIYAPAAHTDGDTYVYFADANVLAVGDLENNGYPIHTDVSNGGNIDGLIAASDAVMRLANDQTQIVRGHGGVIKRTDVAAFKAMLVGARERVAKLVSAGKSEAETIAAAPLQDMDAAVRSTPEDSSTFVRIIYRSLKDEH